MAKVVGIGGVFLKATDPASLYEWYAKHLGIVQSPHGAFMFDSQENPGMTILAFFPGGTDYFGSSEQGIAQRAMVNFRVDDLNALLASLKAQGVHVDEHHEDHDYGRFGWFWDPEGNRVELWEPVQGEAKR